MPITEGRKLVGIITNRDLKFEEDFSKKIKECMTSEDVYKRQGLEGSVIINKVKESPVGFGFDAYKEEYVDMIKAGILDPAKVTRSALQNATSVASTLLTTESVVARCV